MLGRVRAAPISSLELLEMERAPPKIAKQDTLSIYESTLLKLKQGSHCNSRSNPEDSKVDATDSHGEAMTADTDCSSSDSICGESSISSQSTCSSKEQGGRNMSILYFFSKCKSPRNSNDKEAMDIESGYASSSSSVSTTCSS